MDSQLILFLVFLTVMYVAGKWAGQTKLMEALITLSQDSKPFKLHDGKYKLVKVLDEE